MVVFFHDKTKVVVKRRLGDEDDIYAAVAQAICKKIYGGTNHFHKVIDNCLDDFRSPVSIESSVIHSFGNFFNGLWEATH